MEAKVRNVSIWDCKMSLAEDLGLVSSTGLGVYDDMQLQIQGIQYPLLNSVGTKYENTHVQLIIINDILKCIF